MLLQLIFQISSAALLALLINFLGKISRRLGYTNFSDITAEGFLGYNIVFRILSPAVFISLFTIPLYILGLEEFIKNIWLIAVWYAIFSFGIVMVLNRLPLINKPLYFAVQIGAIGLAYAFYSLALSRGLEFVLPDNANFRTELWFVILIFFYSLLNSYEPDVTGYYNRREKLIQRKYKTLSRRYGRIVNELSKEDEFIKDLIYSVMIVEDLNRNKVIRTLERWLFPFGLSKSTGIMQVVSEKPLSDEESIRLGVQKILDLYSRYKDESNDNYNLIRRIVDDYNVGSSYLEAVTNVYGEIAGSYNLYKKRCVKEGASAPGDQTGFGGLENMKDFGAFLDFLEKAAGEIKELVKNEKQKLAKQKVEEMIEK